MEPNTRILAVVMSSLLFRARATTLPDSTIADGLLTSADEPTPDVDTCERIEVSTYAHYISHKWAVENPSDYFNTSGSIDANGKPQVMGSLALENEYGGNWTAQLINLSKRYTNIIFNATFPFDSENTPILISAIALFQFENVTKDGFCFDSFPESQNPGKWTGFCYFPSFKSVEMEKLIDSISFKVVFELSVVYSNAPQTLARGEQCHALKLDALKWSQDAAIELETTTQDIKVHVEEVYAKISKHRISLEWSIRNISKNLNGPLELDASRSVGTLLFPDAIGTFNWTTLVQVRSYLPGKVVLAVVLGTRSHSHGMELLHIARPQVAFTASHKYNKVIPVDSIRSGSRYKKANVEITNEELEQLKNGVVIRMEFEVVYEIHKAT